MKRLSPDFEVIFIENDLSDAAVHRSYQQKQKLYGITKEQFLALAAQNNNCCASCGDDASKYPQTLNVDHDRYTNEIRGLICTGCNTAAGWLDDSPEKAEKLAKYLRNCGTGIFIPE